MAIGVGGRGVTERWRKDLGPSPMLRNRVRGPEPRPNRIEPSRTRKAAYGYGGLGGTSLQPLSQTL